MTSWKVGDTVGYIPKTMRKRFLNNDILRATIWKELEALGQSEIKLFSEIEREFSLNDWVYTIDNVTGGLVLERHKTMNETELVEVQRELIENGEGEVAK